MLASVPDAGHVETENAAVLEQAAKGAVPLPKVRAGATWYACLERAVQDILAFNVTVDKLLLYFDGLMAGKSAASVPQGE
jgi:hypothetical protein